MSAEVTVLALAALLAAGQAILLSGVANLTMSTRWLVGPRDAPANWPPLAGRLNRAYENHLQSLVPFTIAVVVVVVADVSSDLTAAAAIVYLAARVIYGPAYASGVPWVRSLIWAVGFLATLFMLLVGLLE